MLCIHSLSETQEKASAGCPGSQQKKQPEHSGENRVPPRATVKQKMAEVRQLQDPSPASCARWVAATTCSVSPLACDPSPKHPCRVPRLNSPLASPKPAQKEHRGAQNSPFLLPSLSHWIITTCFVLNSVISLDQGQAELSGNCGMLSTYNYLPLVHGTPNRRLRSQHNDTMAMYLITGKTIQ